MYVSAPVQLPSRQWVGTLSATPRGVRPKDHLFVFAGHDSTLGQVIISQGKYSANEEAVQYARPGHLEFGILC